MSVEFAFWYWFVLTVIFLVIEVVVPAFFFLWMSVASLITGIIVWIAPSLSNDVQIVIFSVLAIMAIIAWWLWGKRLKIQSDQPLLNQRGSQYIGRTFNLYEPIENGQGKIKVDDSIWKVHGEDCNINTKVKVVACRGTVFDVEIVK